MTGRVRWLIKKLYNLEPIRTVDEVYIVYSMGKVGSSTVYSTLKRKFNNKIKVFHVHFLSDDGLEKRKNQKQHERNLQIGYEIKEYIKRNPEKKIKIITLVREPVSRAVSNVFQNPANFIGDERIEEMSVDKLIDICKGKKFDFEYTLNWFDEEFYKFTGFNIYDVEFNKKKGFEIYKHNHMDILLIKLEDLSNCFAKCLHLFSGYHFGELVKANVAKNKLISKNYNEFKQKYRENKDVLKKIYQSKFVRHFYGENEINQYVEKWCVKN
jgi:hypothetical protein